MKKIQVTEKQRTFLRGLLSLWWDTPHTDSSYNDSVRKINKLLKRGTYKLGGVDEKSIKHLMEWYTKYN